MSLLAIPSLRALPLVALVAIASPAQADSLEVHVTGDLALDPEQVKAVIAAELGASIVEAAGGLGAVELRLDATRQLVVTHRRADGGELVRVVTLPSLPADRLAVIAFVTGTLVRDQVTDLGVAPPPSAPAPARAETPAVIPAPEVAEVTVPLSLGLIPPLSTDRFWTQRARVRGALNVIMGASASIDGISISGAADLSGNVRGLQLGGAATLGSKLRGAQVAGAVAVASDSVGLQIAGAATIARDLYGIQIAGAGTTARDVRGIQIAGGGAIARRVTGLEIAGGAAITGQIEGAQIASINIAGTVRGLQLGAINIAGRANGLQLGAINIANDSDGAQIGALNFVRNGRTDIDTWIETTELAAIALRHGGRYVHNIYAIGFTPDGGETPLVGMGLGVHRMLGGMTLDLDAMAWQTHMFADGVGLLTQARATLAMDLGGISAFVAAAYNVSIEDRGETRPVRTVLARTISEPMSSVDVALWPSLAVGIRGHLGPLR
jgi:hypothetical protein